MRPAFSVVATLLLVGSCWAAPQQAADPKAGGGLDDLISGVFGKPPGAVASTTSIDDLIGNVFPKPQNPNQGNPINPINPNQGTPNQLNPNQVPSNQDKINPGPASENCECVPYYQCQNGSILDNGVGLIDIRFKADEEDAEDEHSQKAGIAKKRVQGQCDNYLDVCCAPPDVRSPDNPITPRPTVHRGCGQRNPEGVGFRITGAKDNEAQFGEFPWMVAILKEENVGNNQEKLNVYQCGGALIHRRVVLTAGHCINGKQPSMLKVRAGEWDTQTKNEIFPHQDRQVAQVVVHERFHSGALYNDFGLLLLSQPVDIIDNVDIVCLPNAGEVFDFSRCFASGWGKDIFGKEGHYQVILKRVELPVVPRDSCEKSLRSTRLGKYFTLDQTFICAGGESGKDTCKGDGGSPLVCPVKNDPSRFMQAGIVAWGIGCGENQVPGVYANVAAARPWIDQQMRNWNLDTSEYEYRPYN